MKQLLLSIITISLFLVSCSSEETISEKNNNDSKMLESFVVKRNVDGSYALTTNLADGVGAIYFDDAFENQVHLVTNNNTGRSSLNHNYEIIDNQLRIKFVSENNTSDNNLTIFDDAKNTNGRNTDYGLLNNYSIISNEDGTIQLNFEVKDGVSVSYGYNENEEINDIYLIEDTNASDVSFSKSYSIESADGVIRIDFVQPADASSREGDTRKPRVIFDNCPTC